LNVDCVSFGVAGSHRGWLIPLPLSTVCACVHACSLNEIMNVLGCAMFLVDLWCDSRWGELFWWCHGVRLLCFDFVIVVCMPCCLVFEFVWNLSLQYTFRSILLH